jgi:hypothetical protein
VVTDVDARTGTHNKEDEEEDEEEEEEEDVVEEDENDGGSALVVCDATSGGCGNSITDVVVNKLRLEIGADTCGITDVDTKSTSSL